MTKQPSPPRNVLSSWWCLHYYVLRGSGKVKVADPMFTTLPSECRLTYTNMVASSIGLIGLRPEQGPSLLFFLRSVVFTNLSLSSNQVLVFHPHISIPRFLLINPINYILFSHGFDECSRKILASILPNMTFSTNDILNIVHKHYILSINIYHACHFPLILLLHWSQLTHLQSQHSLFMTFSNDILAIVHKHRIFTDFRDIFTVFTDIFTVFIDIFTVFTDIFTIFNSIFSVFVDIFTVFTAIFTDFTDIFTVFTDIYTVFTDIYTVYTDIFTAST